MDTNVNRVAIEQLKTVNKHLKAAHDGLQKAAIYETTGGGAANKMREDLSRMQESVKDLQEDIVRTAFPIRRSA